MQCVPRGEFEFCRDDSGTASRQSLNCVNENGGDGIGCPSYSEGPYGYGTSVLS